MAEAIRSVTPSSMPTGSRVAKNTAYLTVAFFLQKIIALLYIFYVARAIGPEQFGMYSFALAFTAVWGIFIDVGLAPTLVREIARAKHDAPRYLGTVLLVKGMLGILVYGLVILTIAASGKSAFIQGLVALSGVVMLLDSLALTLWGVFRGYQLMHYEAFAIIGVKLVIAIIGVGGIMAGLGVPILLVSLIAGSIFSVLAAATLLRSRLKVRPQFTFDRALFLRFARMALPFAVASVFVTVHNQVGTLFVSYLGGDARTGWYTLASKIMDSLTQILPAALAAAIFPAMSAYYLSSKEKLKETFENSLSYLTLIGVPLAVGIAILAQPLVVRIWGGAWESSAGALQILAVGLLFLFLNYPVGYLLNATNRQTRNTVHIGIAMVVNVIANILLVPQYTFLGASFAATVSSIVLFSLGLFVARRIVSFKVSKLFLTFARASFAAAVMGIVVFLLSPSLSLFVLVPLGVAIYGAALFLVGGIPYADIARLVQLLSRRTVL